MHKTTLVFGFLGVVALAGLFWLFRPDATNAVPGQAAQSMGSTATDGQEAAPQPQSQPAAPASQVVAIEIRQGVRVLGPDVIRVAQGSTLTLALASDADGELHLHGYDRHIHLKAGQIVELSFEASHSGRFEYELHGAGKGGHQALGVIEVLPQ